MVLVCACFPPEGRRSFDPAHMPILHPTTLGLPMASSSSSSSLIVLLILCSTIGSSSSLALVEVVDRRPHRRRRHNAITPSSTSSSAFIRIEDRTRYFVQSNRIRPYSYSSASPPITVLGGWIQRQGEWAWEEDGDTSSSVNDIIPKTMSTTTIIDNPLVIAQATPTLPAGTFRPKQSLGQNFLRDGNTVAKIVRAFVSDAQHGNKGNEQRGGMRAVELGPGAGALTDVLVPTLLKTDGGSINDFRCIEIDSRSVELLRSKHPNLEVIHRDVLMIDYRTLAEEGSYRDVDKINNEYDEDDVNSAEDERKTENLLQRHNHQPLSIIGNLPYYITSQILFALADAAHSDSVSSATVTMQYEVGRRLVASTSTKDYGILSVVFQLYCSSVKMHFKIPPTVFYPQPKVDSALMGLHFCTSDLLRSRLGGVRPRDLRSVVTSAFRQRRKTVRNGLRSLATDVYRGDDDAVARFLDGTPGPLPRCVRELRDSGDVVAMSQELPSDWSTRRPEELTAGQFVELTRMLYGPAAIDVDEDEVDIGVRSQLGNKVWRKLKHGSNN